MDKMTTPDLFMVFDVESIGLHGEGFAVGLVLVRRDGTVLSAKHYACPSQLAQGESEGRLWVSQHIPPLEINCQKPIYVRSAFWADWTYARAMGAVLVADCSWPVEARFLHDCVEDEPYEREWKGPYPLYDVSTAMLMAGRDPLGTYNRLPDELPGHDPLADARQSARLWLECLGAISPIV